MTKMVLVNPVEGVTIYPAGGRRPFEVGRAIPLPEEHANAYVAAGHVTLHVPKAAAPAVGTQAAAATAGGTQAAAAPAGGTQAAAAPAAGEQMTVAELEADIADLGRRAAAMEHHQAP